MTFSFLLYNPQINEFSIFEVMDITFLQLVLSEYTTTPPWILVGKL